MLTDGLVNDPAGGFSTEIAGLRCVENDAAKPHHRDAVLLGEPTEQALIRD